MEKIQSSEHTVADVDLDSLPWRFPAVFLKIMLSTQCPRTILSCSLVCRSWNEWLGKTGNLWSVLLQDLLRKAIMRRVSSCALDKVWSLRLDLLIEMEDECEGEEELRWLAIRCDRATRQAILKDNPEALELLDNLTDAHEEGELWHPGAGPLSLFVRSKVKHPVVLKILGELVSRHLNTVVIATSDKDSPVVRRCVFRSMIGNQPPRWCFKDREEGWLSDFQAPEPEVVPEGVGTAVEREVATPLQVSSSSPEHGTPVPHPEHAASGLVYSVRKFFSNFWSNLLRKFRTVFFRRQAWSDLVEDLDVTGQDVPPNDGIDEGINNVSGDIISPEESNEESPNKSNFPTVMDLLDVDVPWIKSMLLVKFKLDQKFIIPDFQEISRNLDILESGQAFAGLDPEGMVVEMDCSKVESREDGVMLGYLDLAATFNSGKVTPMRYWEERDISSRWPEFARQLEDLSISIEEECVYKDGSVEVNSEASSISYESSDESDSSSSASDKSLEDHDEESIKIKYSEDSVAEKSTLNEEIMGENKLPEDSEVTEEFATNNEAIVGPILDLVQDCVWEKVSLSSKPSGQTSPPQAISRGIPEGLDEEECTGSLNVTCEELVYSEIENQVGPVDVSATTDVAISKRDPLEDSAYSLYSPGKSSLPSSELSNKDEDPLIYSSMDSLKLLSNEDLNDKSCIQNVRMLDDTISFMSNGELVDDIGDANEIENTQS